jgi:hypothetical protein
VPVDFITFGVMQGGIIGLIFVSAVVAALLVKTEQLINRFGPGIRDSLYAYVVLFGPVMLVLYGDPQHVIHRNLCMLFGVPVLAWISTSRGMRNSRTTRYVKPQPIDDAGERA